MRGRRSAMPSGCVLRQARRGHALRWLRLGLLDWRWSTMPGGRMLGQTSRCGRGNRLWRRPGLRRRLLGRRGCAVPRGCVLRQASSRRSNRLWQRHGPRRRWLVCHGRAMPRGRVLGCTGRTRRRGWRRDVSLVLRCCLRGRQEAGCSRQQRQLKRRGHFVSPASGRTVTTRIIPAVMW